MTVNEYILTHENKVQQEILIYLHEVITSIHPAIDDKIRFKIPFYYYNKWICYLNPIPQDGIEICFLHAKNIDDIYGLLNFKDRKMVAGISCYSLEEIYEEALIYYLQASINFLKIYESPSK